MRKQTVRDACRRFLAVTKCKSKSYKTYATYWAREWGSDDLRAVTVERLRDWARGRSAWKQSTINVALAVLSGVYQLAINEGRAKDNPVRRFGWEKPDNERNRFWTPEEVQEILAACDDDLREVVLFAVLTGMRIGEVLALTWSDWQPGGGGQGGVIEVKAQKSKARYLPLHPDAEAVLKRRRRYRMKQPFPGVYQDLYRRFKKVLEQVGIMEGAFHGARHTFGSWLAKENESIYKISKLLGHSTLQQTARYARLQVDDLRGTLSGLDRMKARA